MGALVEFMAHLRKQYDVHEANTACLTRPEPCPDCDRLLPAAEAELAARGERVVEVDPIHGHVRRMDGDECADEIPYMGSQVIFWLRTNAPGRYAVSHRRIPDAPKPVKEKHLKCWPEFFASLASGVKTFDIREERDRDFRVGDMLIMDEYDIETDFYSGRRLGFEVTFCLRLQPWVPEGYVAMGLKPHPLPLPDAPKPATVAVWERRSPLAPVCSHCGSPVSEGELGKPCLDCHNLLASAPTPWPKEECDG